MAALQYASCLMYEDRDNPIFAPWTREDGGGTPGLWETDGQIFNGQWHTENVLFFMETGTPAYLHNALGRAKGALAGVLDSGVPARMLAEFADQQPLLEHRLAVLPDILSKPLDATLAWPPLAPDGS